MTEIKRAKRMNKKQAKSEICVAIHQMKVGLDGLTAKYYELVDMNLALQNENEQLRVALQNSKLERAEIPRRERAKTFQGKSIE